MPLQKLKHVICDMVVTTNVNERVGMALWLACPASGLLGSIVREGIISRSRISIKCCMAFVAEKQSNGLIN